jgi:16S rRNA (guanine(527)-N(7))-methyltransferase RsmG
MRTVWADAPALEAGQWQKLETHYALLQKWNPKVNLVGASTLGDAAVKHYGESLFLAAGLPEGVHSVVDVGSGAGFPGFPLAVMYPGLSVLLLESDKRKAAFLRESCELSNLRVLNARMEGHMGSFDAVVSRAVDPRVVVAWARKRASLFGFVGATDDTRLLSESVPFLIQSQTALPWRPSSSVFWGAFHVKHP